MDREKIQFKIFADPFEAQYEEAEGKFKFKQIFIRSNKELRYKYKENGIM